MARTSLKDVPWNEVTSHGRLWTDTSRDAHGKGELKMGELMSFSEIQRRYQNKENPFDLTIEKWIRIRQFAYTASTLSDYRALFQAANVAVPFCVEYQRKNCLGCPLEKICGPGKGEKLLKVMKLIQTQRLAILAGNRFSKASLPSEIDGLLMELEMLKAKSIGGSE